MKRNAKVLAAAMSLGLAGAAATGAAVFGKNADGARDWRKDRIERMFERYDLNKDGAIDRDEAATAADPFKRADKDGDGKLTAEEMQADAAERASARAARMHDRLDANDDGVVDAEEMEKARERHDRGWRRGDRHGPRHGSHHGWRHGSDHGPDGGFRHGRFWDPNAGGPFGSDNGRGGRDFAGLADRMFERLDADDDGAVTRAEIEAFRAERAGE